MSDRPPIPSGLLLIDKPADRRITSMAVCRGVKKRLTRGGATDTNRKKGLRVGHAGTLDPLASGLLIVLVGKAARLCNELMEGDKTYETVIDLARSSTTDDLEGRLTDNFAAITAQDSGGPPPHEKLEQVLRSFTGLIHQRPPAYSAMIIDGTRAYHLARAGKAPEMQPRPILIHEIEILEYTFPLARLRIRCGKGTYIRSLARDIGIALTGHAGSLAALRRTAIGPYRVEDAIPLADLPQTLTEKDLRQAVG